MVREIVRRAMLVGCVWGAELPLATALDRQHTQLTTTMVVARGRRETQTPLLTQKMHTELASSLRQTLTVVDGSDLSADKFEERLRACDTVLVVLCAGVTKPGSRSLKRIGAAIEYLDLLEEEGKCADWGRRIQLVYQPPEYTG